VVKREAAEPFRQEHFDVAAGIQAATEEVLFHLLRRLRQVTKSENLCLAGGVFQNSVANGKIRQSGLFKNVHVPSVPGDHGGALGAGLWAAREDVVRRPGRNPVSAFLGPGYGADDVEEALDRAQRIVYHRPSRLGSAVASLLAEGRILAWFQGRSEYGPRALGNRSILADPRRAEMKDIVNERIKHREPFRPFAGAVPLERASEYFELSGPSPFMQFVVPIRPDAREKIPAISHGGTCRVQTVCAEENPAFHDLLLEFGKISSIPILLNTSFNDADEPIVCSPADALRTFLKTDLDGLVIGPFFVSRSADDRAAPTLR
jgi:carbamoyltransferase